MALAVLVAAAGLVAGTGQARAVTAFYNGNKLLALCDGASYEKGVCTGFVAGVADTLAMVTEDGGNLDGFRACMPQAATVGQTRDIVAQFLRAHPEKRHLIASLLAAEALAVAFPCSKR